MNREKEKNISLLALPKFSDPLNVAWIRLPCPWISPSFFFFIETVFYFSFSDFELPRQIFSCRSHIRDGVCVCVSALNHLHTGPKSVVKGNSATLTCFPCKCVCVCVYSLLQFHTLSDGERLKRQILPSSENIFVFISFFFVLHVIGKFFSNPRFSFFLFIIFFKCFSFF